MFIDILFSDDKMNLIKADSFALLRNVLFTKSFVVQYNTINCHLTANINRVLRNYLYIAFCNRISMEAWRNPHKILISICKHAFNRQSEI